MMKAPIWYLIARVSNITGGTGWHRSYLIDVAFQHLSQWWLAGMSIEGTSDWLPYMLSTTGGADITNEFIGFALTAGIGAIALLILVLTRGFSSIGNALACVRSRFREPEETEFLLWGLGAMLAVNVVNWLGISYFDQSYVVWFMQLATVSSLSEDCLQAGSEVETHETVGWLEEKDLHPAEAQF
jgi:hypothetical protein